jgi:hypothetical protein
MGKTMARGSFAINDAEYRIQVIRASQGKGTRNNDQVTNKHQYPNSKSSNGRLHLFGRQSPKERFLYLSSF